MGGALVCMSGGVGVVSYPDPVISLGGCVQGVDKDITWYLSVLLNASIEFLENGGLTSYMTITSAH